MDRVLDFFRGKSRLPTALEKALKQYGGETIKNVIVCRAPVQKGIQTLLNVATGGELDRKLKASEYTDLYHLSMYLVLSNGKKFKIEKNDRINFVIDPPEEKVECDMVSGTVNAYFNQFIEKAIKRVGIKQFVEYHPRTANCQDFLLNLLKANNISNPSLEKFIKQDAEDLVFKDFPKLGKIGKIATDIAATVNEAKEIYEEVKDHPLVQIGKALLPSSVSGLGDFFKATIKGDEGPMKDITKKETAVRTTDRESEPDKAAVESQQE